MTAFPGREASFPGQDADKYAHWDAAYVLGSLPEADNREFEAHLDGKTCPYENAAVMA